MALVSLKNSDKSLDMQKYINCFEKYVVWKIDLFQTC